MVPGEVGDQDRNESEGPWGFLGAILCMPDKDYSFHNAQQPQQTQDNRIPAEVFSCEPDTSPEQTEVDPISRTGLRR